MAKASSSFGDSKRHYLILDGLRGVAAVVVVIFHLLETFTGGDHTKQIINHGYLAVDFFFLLSGFVIGYAYDDRWGKMSVTGFFRRRLIRLHPMIIMGMLIGGITFYWQAGPLWPQIANTPVWLLLLVMFIGFTLLPVPLSMDIRGWTEMHPLDGPAWSLFFEYIANILYALVIRKFSKGWLAFFVFLAGAALIHLAVTSPNGDIIGGWALDGPQLRVGFSRLLYPFFAGLLLSRTARLTRLNNAFLWCSLLLVAVLAVPRIGGSDQAYYWLNGLYDALAVVLVFPLIVYLGASGEIRGAFANRLCRFLGDISYPLYIIHYPFIYLFTSWVYTHRASLNNPSAYLRVAFLASGVLVFSILLAYACLKFYDEPIRKWLTKKFMPAAERQ